jgi:hypothetical protein
VRSSGNAPPKSTDPSRDPRTSGTRAAPDRIAAGGPMRKRLVALAFVVGLLSVPLTAYALPGTYLTVQAIPGEPIFGGAGANLTTANATFNASYDGSMISVAINSGSIWVRLAAPPGQPLVPGTYTNAVRAEFRGPGQNGIDVFGNGVGCNTTSGSFTVNQAVYGPTGSGYVQTFDATFSQLCDNNPSPTAGEISIDNPPPPPQLQINLVVATKGTTNLGGVATLHGTATCNETASIQLYIILSERLNRFSLAQGSSFGSFACVPGNTTNWQQQIPPSGSVPFGSGRSLAQVQLFAADPNYPNPVSSSFSQTVNLAGHN